LIYGLYNFKYLPAVPLKLGDSGFYSYIQKVDNGSSANYYKENKGQSVNTSFYGFLKETSFKRDDLSENSLYFFSSVVSPQNAPIKSIISHSWEKYNIVTKK
jgi:hypothetical protein